MQNTRSNFCNFVYGSDERSLVGFGGLIEAADFSHELQRRSPDLFLVDGRIEVKKRFDISAHAA
jgi:hypothetical protein